ncbi:MAG: hypothetical protein AAGA54_29860 [Myxococcota bacterium]
MGRDVHGPFCGSDWFIDDVVSNTAYVPGLLAENSIARRPDGDVLAFFSHQGYMVAWFALPAAMDDPPCFMFSEGSLEAGVHQVGPFSAFLLGELRAMAECMELIRG